MEKNEIKTKDPVTPQTWTEFRASGLLWFINTILHLFGWAIACELDEEGQVKNAYPARVVFRGFSETLNSDGYKKVSQYLFQNIEELKEEADN